MAHNRTNGGAVESYNFYMQAKVIKRDGGRSVGRRRSIIAVAAYRAAETLHDATIDKTFHYAHRQNDVESTKIIAPAGAPAWVQDRSELWNRVEAAEKRRDAQLAREIIFQFPHEVPLDACSEMIWDFCERHFADHGMVADIAVHAPGAGDERNKHVHVLLTMRFLEPEGFGLKNRAWNANQMLENWRADWEEVCNKALADLQSDIRFDRRSIADQRAEKLDAAEATFDWIKRRRFEIEAERLNYFPRPHLPQKVYRAMVAGEDIPEEYQAAVAYWQIARDSKAAARTRAAEMQRQLDAEIAAAKDAEAETEAAPNEQASAEPDSSPEAPAPSHYLYEYLPQLLDVGLRTLDGGWQRFPALSAAIYRYQEKRFDPDPYFGTNLAHSGATERPWDPDLDADLPSTEGTDADTPPPVLLEANQSPPPLPPETPAPIIVTEPTSDPDPAQAAPETPAPAPEAPVPSPAEADAGPRLHEPALLDASAAVIADSATAEIDDWWKTHVEIDPDLGGVVALLAEAYPDQDVMHLVVLAGEQLIGAKYDPSHHLYAYLPQLLDIGRRTLNGGWQRFPALAAAIIRYQKIRFDHDPYLFANLGHTSELERLWGPDLDADLPSIEGTYLHIPPLVHPAANQSPPPLPPETPAPIIVIEPPSDPDPAQAPPQPPAPAPEAPDRALTPDVEESAPERPEPAASDADTSDEPAPEPDPAPDIPDPEPVSEDMDSVMERGRPYWELERQMLALQREQKDRQGAKRRREEQDKRKADQKKHMERVRREEADPISWAVEELFSPYPIPEEATRNPGLEWLRALALRALDPGQSELRQLLENDFQLKVDDPIALRKSISALSETDLMRTVIAIDDLDRKMDADPDRNWKQRRQAFTEMIDFHRNQRVCPEQSRESPIHIFKTSIKSICESSGLKSFYDNVLVPLVSRIAEALRLKSPQPSSKPDPDSNPSPSGADHGMS